MNSARWSRPCTGRHRSDPGRRLQPHLRRRRKRALPTATKGSTTATYYISTGDPPPYANYSGTGNTLQTANRARPPADRRQPAVSGSRRCTSTDSASTWPRSSPATRDGSIDLTTPPIFDQIAGDAEFDGIHLIAEPWDAGGLYQLGSKFPGLTLDAVERPLPRHAAAIRAR